jgi:hypothetical protein
LLQEFLHTIKANDITPEKIMRLGQRKEEKSRPILIRVENLQQKETIMSNLCNLRDANEQFKSVAVRHDLTQEQRDELKDLIADARKQSEQSEDFFYLVRSKKGPLWEPFVMRTKKKKKE